MECGLRPCSGRERKTLKGSHQNHGGQASCRMGPSHGIAMLRPSLAVPLLSEELKSILETVPRERLTRRPLGDPKWNSVMYQPIPVLGNSSFRWSRYGSEL